MPELNTVTDPYLPEPKGVASAQDGQVYVSNGAGSGSWLYLPSGFGLYDDNTAQVITSSATKLSINGLGPRSQEAYLPRAIRGSTSLWNISTDFITPIAVGDTYMCRLDLPITAEGASPTELEVDLDISGAGTPTTVVMAQYEKTGKSTPYTVSFAFPVFVDSNFLANGGQFFLSTDTGTVTITNASLLLVQTGSGDI